MPHWMKQPGELHDKKGVPIYPGDLLRSFHFQERRYRRKHYLYHTAVYEGGAMRMVPTSELEPTLKHRGGNCLMSQTIANGVEVISGHGPGDCLDFHDRKRITHGSSSTSTSTQSPGPAAEPRSE